MPAARFPNPFDPFDVIDGILDGLGSTLGDIADLLNPFEWLSKACDAIITNIFKLVLALLSNDNRPTDQSWNDQLLHGTLPVAYELIALVLAWAIVVTVVSLRRGFRLLHAFLTFGFIVSLGTSIVTVGEQIRDAGDQLNGGIFQFFHQADPKLQIPKIDNVLISLIVDGPIIWYALGVIINVVIYLLVVPVVYFVLPIAIALGPLNDRTKILLDKVLSYAIVAFFIGKPLMSAIVLFGIVLGKDSAYSGSLLTAIVLVATMRIAAKSQKNLRNDLFRTIQNITNTLRARVEGAVDATLNGRPTIMDASYISMVRAASLQPAATSYYEAPIAKPTVAHDVARSGFDKLNAKLTAVAATAPHPAAKAAATVGAYAANRASRKVDEHAGGY